MMGCTGNCTDPTTIKLDRQDDMCSSPDGKTKTWHRISMFWQAYSNMDIFI
jgi:hypothetical protein